MWFFGPLSSHAALGRLNDPSDNPGKMNNEDPLSTNENRKLIINSGEHRNMHQWEVSTGLTKWGIKSESRNILTATTTVSLALLLSPSTNNLLLTRLTVPFNTRAYRDPQYNISSKNTKPNGHRWALNHLLEGGHRVRGPSSPVAHRVFQRLRTIYSSFDCSKALQLCAKALEIAPDFSLTSTRRSFTTGVL